MCFQLTLLLKMYWVRRGGPLNNVLIERKNWKSVLSLSFPCITPNNLQNTQLSAHHERIAPMTTGKCPSVTSKLTQAFNRCLLSKGERNDEATLYLMKGKAPQTTQDFRRQEDRFCKNTVVLTFYAMHNQPICECSALRSSRDSHIPYNHCSFSINVWW